jgi:hypothetical protein
LYWVWQVIKTPTIVSDKPVFVDKLPRAVKPYRHVLIFARDNLLREYQNMKNICVFDLLDCVFFFGPSVYRFICPLIWLVQKVRYDVVSYKIIRYMTWYIWCDMMWYMT